MTEQKLDGFAVAFQPVPATGVTNVETVAHTVTTEVQSDVAKAVATNIIPQMDNHFGFATRMVTTKVRAPKQTEIDSALAEGKNPPLVWGGAINFVLPSVDADQLANYLMSEGDTPEKAYIVATMNNAIQAAHYAEWLSRQDKTQLLNLNGFKVDDYTLTALANRPESDRIVYPEYDAVSEAAFLAHYKAHLEAIGKTIEQVTTHVTMLDKDMAKLNAIPAEIRQTRAEILKAHVTSFLEAVSADVKAECEAATDRILARLTRWATAEVAKTVF